MVVMMGKVCRDSASACGFLVHVTSASNISLRAESRVVQTTAGSAPGRVLKRASCRRSGSPVEKPWTYSSGVSRPSGSRNTCREGRMFPDK